VNGDTTKTVRGKLKPNAPLAPLVWFKSGGSAEWLFEPADRDDPRLVVDERDDGRTPLRVARRRDHAGGLVEEHVGQTLLGDRLPVDLERLRDLVQRELVGQRPHGPAPVEVLGGPFHVIEPVVALRELAQVASVALNQEEAVEVPGAAVQHHHLERLNQVACLELGEVAAEAVEVGHADALPPGRGAGPAEKQGARAHESTRWVRTPTEAAGESGTRRQRWSETEVSRKSI